jgi:hypothetical protein
LVSSATTECPGSFSNPKAVAEPEESVLCIYKSFFLNVASTVFQVAGPAGVIMAPTPEEAGPERGFGTFAVTAG